MFNTEAAKKLKAQHDESEAESLEPDSSEQEDVESKPQDLPKPRSEGGSSLGQEKGPREKAQKAREAARILQGQDTRVCKSLLSHAHNLSSAKGGD